MSLAYEPKEFTQKGRVAKGEAPRKYTAQQLKDGSVDASSSDSLMADLFEAASNDRNTARQIIFLGINAHNKKLAGGTDNATQAARAFVKAGFGGGKSVAEIAQDLRDGKIKF